MEATTLTYGRYDKPSVQRPAKPTYRMDPDLLHRNVPAVLQALPQWVTWNYEYKDGKWTKVPHNPQSGWLASVTAADTWSTFDKALAGVRQFGHTGIGLVFATQGGIVGIDHDHCRDPRTEQLNDLARKNVAELASYTEVSPSGEGVKTICYGALPPDPARSGAGRKNERGEMYEAMRFFTITGQHLPESPTTVEHRTGGITTVYARLFPSKVVAFTNSPSMNATSALSDDQVLAKARAAKNGAKFTALYDRGDTSAYADDDSAADLALCGLLEFWTQDRAQVERLMGRSQLGQRDKWRNRADYRTRTIQAAFSSGGEHYADRQAPPPPAGTYQPPAADPLSAAAPIEPPAAGHVTPFDQDGEHLTDMGNASRLVRVHGANLRYTKGWGWLIYEGGRWSRDETGGAMRYAKATVKGMYTEAGQEPDSAKRGQLVKHALVSESANRLAALLKLAESEHAIAATTDDFDQDPWLLNCRNGTINLRSGALRPHDRADLITKHAPVDYDPAAECPTWRAFLARIFEPVPEVISFLQRAIGYTLTGSTGEQVMFLLHGTGANGKSTLLQTLQTVLGEYAQSTPAATLLTRDKSSATNDLARMAGARFVAANETEDGKHLAESLVKQMTGGDKITARYLHQEFFEFTPSFKLFLATNHKPIIRGTDYAIWRRILLIPFLVTIPEEDRDPLLMEKLAIEAPGILNWALEGCLLWQEYGLAAPPVITSATSDYRAEMDLMAAFLDECCVVDRTFMVPAGALYTAYKTWAEENGERPITQRAFSLRLQERGYQTERRGAGSRPQWIGIRLTTREE